MKSIIIKNPDYEIITKPPVLPQSIEKEVETYDDGDFPIIIIDEEDEKIYIIG